MSLLRWFAPLLFGFLDFALTGGHALADDWFGDPVVTAVDEYQLRIVVADFNQDGTDDVVTNTTAYNYALYRGHPSGHLQIVQTIPGELWGRAKALEENQDDWPDLICEEPGAAFRVWRNDGTGLLVDSGTTVPGYDVLSVGLLPGDSYQDVLVQSGTDWLSIYYGGPDGLTLDTDPILLRAQGELPGTFWINRAVLFDLNLDSVPDVYATGRLTAEWLPEMRWRLGHRDGSFGDLQQFGFYSPLSDFDAFDIRDRNGDWDPEIAVMWVGFE
jgi:hypothetical protein